MDSVDNSRPILTYPIASGEMHYVVENQRTVYFQGDPETGFSLCGRIADGSEASTVNLAEVLFEFAMTWNTPGDPSEARRQMRIFGGNIGEALADQSTQAEPVDCALGRAASVLKDVFCSLDVSFTVQHTKNEVRYELDQYPLRVAAEVTGMGREAELAHHALNAICQSVVNAIDPQLQIQLPGASNGEHAISLLAPASNGR